LIPRTLAGTAGPTANPKLNGHTDETGATSSRAYEACVGEGMHREERSGAQQERAPVRWTVLERQNGDVHCTPGLVLDHDGVGIAASHLLSEPTGNRVGASSRRKSDNDLCEIEALGVCVTKRRCSQRCDSCELAGELTACGHIRSPGWRGRFVTSGIPHLPVIAATVDFLRKRG